MRQRCHERVRDVVVRHERMQQRILFDDNRFLCHVRQELCGLLLKCDAVHLLCVSLRWHSAKLPSLRYQLHAVYRGWRRQMRCLQLGIRSRQWTLPDVRSELPQLRNKRTREMRPQLLQAGVRTELSEDLRPVCDELPVVQHPWCEQMRSKSVHDGIQLHCQHADLQLMRNGMSVLQHQRSWKMRCLQKRILPGW